MHEAVLDQPVGPDPTVMSGQLAYLAEVFQWEHVIIQILPRDAPEGGKIIGPFVLANSDSGRMVAYVDTPLAGQYIEDPEEVARLQQLYEEVFRKAAVSPTVSLSLIQEAAERWHHLKKQQ
jgi:hypothetical protein